MYGTRAGRGKYSAAWSCRGQREQGSTYFSCTVAPQLEDNHRVSPAAVGGGCGGEEHAYNCASNMHAWAAATGWSWQALSPPLAQPKVTRKAFNI